MKNERDIYWDVVKGLMIMAIVLGHSGLSNIAVLIIMNFYHIAMFFFVSGFLYKDKYSKDPYGYIGRKMRYLWWPTIKYVVVFVLLHNTFIRLNIYSEVIDYPMIYPKTMYTKYEIINNSLTAILNTTYAEEMAGAMWVILPLILVMGIFCIIRYSSERVKIHKEIYSFIIVMVLGAIGMKLAELSLKFAWRLDVALLTIPIVYSGYIAKRHWDKINFRWYGALLATITLYASYKSGTEISYAAGIIGTPIRFIIATSAGIYLNLYVATKILKINYLSKAIAYIGKNSFHIMALHFLSFKVINVIDVMLNQKDYFMIAQFPYSNANWWPLNFLSGLLIPICCINVYNFFKASITILYTKITNHEEQGC